MALVTVGLPIFSGGPDEDVERHIELFSGYISGLGINPADMAGGPPTGMKRTDGLFRASLSGVAGEWYDEEFIGKHWELNNLFNNHGQNTWANIVARTMQQLTTSNSFRDPSGALNYANVPANNGTTLANSGLLPAYGLIQNWDSIGGRPTIRPATNIAGGGDGNPVVLPEIRLGNKVYWFRKNYTTVQRARREAKFGDLVQGDLPIDIYYKELERTGKLLEYPEHIIENQFFRGLNAENLIESERQGDRPLADLVASLKRIEKRKAEMKLGVSRRNVQYNQDVIPVQAPVISSQEPTILKPVTSHAITQDMLNKLLQSHTESLTKNFQAQLQTLQDTVSQSQKKAPPPIPPKDHRKIHEWYESHNPFDDDYDRQYSFDEIMGNNSGAMQYAKMFAKASAKAKKDKMERKVNKLANMMGNLDIDDDGPLPMDIDLTDGIILQDADGNEFTVCLTRGSKKK